MNIFGIIIVSLSFFLFTEPIQSGEESFNPQENQVFLDLIPFEEREDFIQALQDAGGNWKELSQAVLKAIPERRKDIIVAVAQSAFETIQITRNYTPTGFLRLKFLSGGKPKVGFEHFSVNVFNRGALRPLDDLGAGRKEEEMKSDSLGIFECELGDGKYIVEAGVRDNTGSVWVVMKEIQVFPGKTTESSLELTPEGYVESLPKVRELGEKAPLFTLPSWEGELIASADYLEKKNLGLFILILNHEPSLRMLPLVENVFNK